MSDRISTTGSVTVGSSAPGEIETANGFAREGERATEAQPIRSMSERPCAVPVEKGLTFLNRGFHLDSRVERRASSVERRASSVERRASSVERRASSVERRASSVERRASSVERRASSVERRASSVERRASSRHLNPASPPPRPDVPPPRRGGESASTTLSARRLAGLAPRALVRLAVAVALYGGLLSAPAWGQAVSAPAKPTGLSAEVAHDSVTLTWNDPGDDSITGYVILWRVRVNDTGGKFSELVPDTRTAATTYTDDAVVAETTYTYRIKAINKHGVSERSRWFHIDIPAAPEPDEEQSAEPPAKPTGLSATASHDSVALTWDDPGDDTITGYVILRRVRVNDTGGEFSELVPDTGSAATTYTDDTVAAETTYTYRIKAINKHGVSERSRWFHIDIPEAPEPEEEQSAEPPARPTGVVSAVSSDLVLLSWADPGDDSITGYRILRRGIADEADDFLTLAEDTGTAETSYADDTVERETSYVYRVLAINPGGVSEPSQDLRARTNAPVAPPEPARGLPNLTTPQPRQSVPEPPGEDLPDDDTTTGRVEAGEPVMGNIDRANDIDAFVINMVDGRRYLIDVEGADTSQGTLADPELFGVYRINPEAVDTFDRLFGTRNLDDGEGKNARITFTLDTELGGTYYILVTAQDNTTGTYRLSVMETAGGYGKFMPLEGRLTPGNELRGTLPVHDGYFGVPYYFALEDLEVGRYTVSFSTGDIDSIHTFWRRPDNSTLDNVWLLTDQAFGRSSYTFDVRPHRVGPHYALLYIRQGAGGAYTATLEEAMPSLTVGGPAVDGRIKSGGEYSGYGTYMLFYSVDLEDGETYQVDIKGKDTCNDCTMDRTMLGHVQAPDGSFVEDDKQPVRRRRRGGAQHPLRLHCRPGRHALPEGGRPDIYGQRWRQPLPCRDLQGVGAGGTGKKLNPQSAERRAGGRRAERPERGPEDRRAATADGALRGRAGRARRGQPVHPAGGLQRRHRDRPPHLRDRSCR